jgi:hypothetical protein
MSEILTKDTSAIVAEITADVKQRIPDWFGDTAELSSSLPELNQYPNSYIARYQVHVDGDEKTLLVKVPSKPYVLTLSEALSRKDARSRAREQYAAALRVWKAIAEENDERCLAVKPFAHLYDWNAVAMEEVDGKMLKVFLLRPAIAFRLPGAWRKLRRVLYNSTRWLRIVHQRIGNPRTSSIKIDDLKSQIEEELIALRRYSKERVNIDTYRQKLYELLGAVSNSSVPTALLHDDFQYSNILISSSGSACALDSSFSRRGAVYSDVATLLVDPETRLVQLLSFGLFLSKQRIVQLRELVLESYFQDSPINQLSLKLYCALAILHKWTVDEKRFSSGGLQQLLSPLLIPVIRFNFKRILKPYLSLHVERKKS